MTAHHAIIIDIKRVNPDFAGPPDDEWVDEASFIAQLDAPATAGDWMEIEDFVNGLFDLLDGGEYTDEGPDGAWPNLTWHHPMYEVTAREATLYEVPVPDAPGT